MIINNKSIRGIYPYNSTAEYEKGDFIVDGDCIFICTANNPTNKTNFTVKGQKPIDSTTGKFNLENYTVYPGDLITSADEYYDIVKNNGNGAEDKYISSYALCEILKKSYFGINENGIITDHVLYSPENNEIDYSVGNKSISEYLDETTSVLTKILIEPDLNNGILMVSRNLPEIKDLFLETVESDYPPEGGSQYYISTDVVLLRQYTYIENKEKYRVQELLDQKTGESFFRCLKSKQISTSDWAIDNELTKYELEGGSISAWKSNFGGETNGSYSKRIINRLNTVIESYRSRLEDYNNKINQLDDSFRFKEATTTGQSGNIIQLSEVPVDTPITVVCSYNTGISSGVKISFSITIPVISEGSAKYYLGGYKDQEFYLHQMFFSTNGSLFNKFSITDTPDDSTQMGNIDSIYYRRKFDRDTDAII